MSEDCYSGRFPDGFNNPAKETIPDVGPIMCGNWTIFGPPKDGALWGFPELGPYVLRLEPDGATRKRLIQFGRDPNSFYLHGKPRPPADIRSGSKGCLCADPDTRRRVYQSGDVNLQVIAGPIFPDVDGEIAT